MCIWGLIKLSAWETIFGMVIVLIGKSWFLDRMVWLYDEMKVSVESAELHGMKDFLIVHRSHPFIMNDKKVLQQIVASSKNGMFDRDKSTEQ